MTHLLIIDSDAQTHQWLKELVAEFDDLTVVPALTAGEGVRLAARHQPDLILLDTALPGASGIEAVTELRSASAGTPIVVITEPDAADRAIEAFRAGVWEILTKPLRPSDVMDVLTRAQEPPIPPGEQDSLAQRLLQATQELRRQQRELNAVHEIGRLTTSLLDLDMVLERLTEIAVHLTEADESVLLLRDPNTDKLYLKAGKYISGELGRDFSVAVDAAGPGQAIRAGSPVLMTGRQASITPDGTAEAALYVPLGAPDRVIGLLGLVSREREDAFSQQDVVLLSTLADYAAIAIENARLFEASSRAKSLMDSVFWSIASGVIALDQQNRVSLVSRAAKEILEAPHAQPGAPVADALPAIADTLGPLTEWVKRTNEPQGPLEVDLSLPSGRIVKLRTTLSPLRQGTRPAEGVAIIVEDVTQQRRLESRFRLFQRYLSPTVIERLPDDPQELELGGVRQEVACLFADLRGFVDFSVRCPPDALVEILNTYLGIGAEAILEQEGTLDKFVGDAVVAFFNAPLAQEDYVLRALRAAVNIRERTRQLHQRLPRRQRLTYGIGVSAGEAIVGNIGTPQRLDYTAIGPSVNVANRLQAAAKPGQILLAEAVYQRAEEHIHARPILLEGMGNSHDTTQVFELLDLS